MVDVSPKRRPAAGRGTEPLGRGEGRPRSTLKRPADGRRHWATATRRVPQEDEADGFLSAGGRWRRHWCGCDACRCLSCSAIALGRSSCRRVTRRGRWATVHRCRAFAARGDRRRARCRRRGCWQALGSPMRRCGASCCCAIRRAIGPARARCRSTTKARACWSARLAEAKKLGDSRIQTEHMLLALVRDRTTQRGQCCSNASAFGASRVQREVLRVSTEKRGWMAEVSKPTFGVWETLDPTGQLRSVLVAAASWRSSATARTSSSRTSCSRSRRTRNAMPTAGRARDPGRARARAARAPSLDAYAARCWRVQLIGPSGTAVGVGSRRSSFASLRLAARGGVDRAGLTAVCCPPVSACRSARRAAGRPRRGRPRPPRARRR